MRFIMGSSLPIIPRANGNKLKKFMKVYGVYKGLYWFYYIL